ncbi:HSFX1 protein, partial [Bucorvus abyssinicus]|nr:HSFX1 protein [Bucorvus abyssinicus]
MEPPSPEISWASDPEKPDWREASTSPDHPGGDMGSSADAATGALTEENASQGLPDESWAPSTEHHFWEEICAKTTPSSARSFLKQLWRIIGSHCFQSIWWGDDGSCAMITEKLVKTEVLGRRRHLKSSETESMRGFILQLNLHGFCQTEEHSPISTSIEELQAVAGVGSAHKRTFR